jgi:hypothetical protein
MDIWPGGELADRPLSGVKDGEYEHQLHDLDRCGDQHSQIRSRRQ